MLFEIQARVVYSYKNERIRVEAETEEGAFLRFYQMRADIFKLVPAYGQLRPESIRRVELDGQGRYQPRELLQLPDWVWDRPDGLSTEHPLARVIPRSA